MYAPIYFFYLLSPTVSRAQSFHYMMFVLVALFVDDVQFVGTALIKAGHD